MFNPGTESSEWKLIELGRVGRAVKLYWYELLLTLDGPIVAGFVLIFSVIGR